MGGNVRVGLEDSVYLAKGRLATSNAEQVEKMRGSSASSRSKSRPRRRRAPAGAERARNTSPFVTVADSGAEAG